MSADAVQNRMRLPMVRYATRTVELGLADIIPFFASTPAEDLMYLELLPFADVPKVRVGLIDYRRVTLGTIAQIPRMDMTIRGFYRDGKAIYLTGKKLPMFFGANELLATKLMRALSEVKKADGTEATWISFHGVNNSSIYYDGSSWVSLVPSEWSKQHTMVRCANLNLAPQCRVIGVMDGYIYAFEMAITDKNPEPENTETRRFTQRMCFHYSRHAHRSKSDWISGFIEHSVPRVLGVGLLGRVKTKEIPHEKRPSTGFRPPGDSIFTHVNFADQTVATLTFYPGEQGVSLVKHGALIDWPVPPTVLSVVRSHSAGLADGLIVQELQPDNSLKIHFLEPDFVPVPLRPYLSSQRP